MFMGVRSDDSNVNLKLYTPSENEVEGIIDEDERKLKIYKQLKEKIVKPATISIEQFS